MWQYIDTNLQKNEPFKIAKEIILHSYSRGGLASNLKSDNLRRFALSN